MSLGVSTVEAGCKTLFVCYAEEPNALAELDPEPRFAGAPWGAVGRHRGPPTDAHGPRAHWPRAQVPKGPLAQGHRTTLCPQSLDENPHHLEGSWIFFEGA